MLNLAIGMFEDIGRLSMAAKHYKVLLRLLQQGLLEICENSGVEMDLMRDI
jgi:hypothetical protein